MGLRAEGGDGPALEGGVVRVGGGGVWDPNICAPKMSQRNLSKPTLESPTLHGHRHNCTCGSHWFRLKTSYFGPIKHHHPSSNPQTGSQFKILGPQLTFILDQRKHRSTLDCCKHNCIVVFGIVRLDSVFPILASSSILIHHPIPRS